MNILNLPNHLSLELTHNEYQNEYMSLEQWLERGPDEPDWPDDEERQRAIDLGEIWILRVHHRTPVSFDDYAAATLGRVMQDWFQDRGLDQ